MEKSLERVRGAGFFTRCMIATVLWLGVGLLGWALWTATGAIRPVPLPSRPTADASTEHVPSTVAQTVIPPRLTVRVDPQVSLNPAWKDKFGTGDGRRGMEGVPLSASGYPVIVVRMPVAVCADPYRVQLAMDIVRAHRNEEVGRVLTCVMLRVGQDAEWTNPNPFDNGLVEIRLHRPGTIPTTFYGPSPNGADQPFFAWFGTLVR